jgi:hypothetical protein
MPLPVAAAWWIAPVVTTLLLALPVLAIWHLERRRPRAGFRAAEVEDDAGAGEGRVAPTPVPPSGGVSWDEFERQFLEYVERSSRPDGPDRSRR